MSLRLLFLFLAIFSLGVVVTTFAKDCNDYCIHSNVNNQVSVAAGSSVELLLAPATNNPFDTRVVRSFCIRDDSISRSSFSAFFLSPFRSSNATINGLLHVPYFLSQQSTSPCAFSLVDDLLISTNNVLSIYLPLTLVIQCHNFYFPCDIKYSTPGLDCLNGFPAPPPCIATDLGWSTAWSKCDLSTCTQTRRYGTNANYDWPGTLETQPCQDPCGPSSGPWSGVYVDRQFGNSYIAVWQFGSRLTFANYDPQKKSIITGVIGTPTFWQLVNSTFTVYPGTTSLGPRLTGDGRIPGTSFRNYGNGAEYVKISGDAVVLSTPSAAAFHLPQMSLILSLIMLSVLFTFGSNLW